jgi:hypothetical protein
MDATACLAVSGACTLNAEYSALQSDGESIAWRLEKQNSEKKTRGHQSEAETRLKHPN